MKRWFILLCMVSGTGCYKNVDDYIQQNRYSILSVNSSANTLAADGKSMLFFSATLTPDANIKTVQFLTTNGHFLDSGVSYTALAGLSNNQLIARAYLVAPLDTTSFAFVTVSVPGLDTVVNIRMVTAPPDSIHTESTINTIVKGYESSVPLMTRLIRDIGHPSLHQTVSYSAIRDNSTSIGNFVGIDPAGSDSLGRISATYYLGDTTYTGRVRIITSFFGAKPLTDTFAVIVTPK